MRKSKDDIVTELRESFHSVCAVAASIDKEGFNVSKHNKWTTAENVSHLVRSTKMTRLAYQLPKFLPLILYGKPSRTSHGYSKIISNYLKKLESGAVATGLYVPSKTSYNQTVLVDKLMVEGEKLVSVIENKWSDEQLDHYQIEHPLLGLITLRELAYFTIYHNLHHLATISNLYAAGN